MRTTNNKRFSFPSEIEQIREATSPRISKKTLSKINGTTKLNDSTVFLIAHFNDFGHQVTK